MTKTIQYISREEQVEMGLIRNINRQGSRFVPAITGEVLPPVRAIPPVVDPYAPVMPQSMQQMVRVDITPISRAQAMVMKVNMLTLALAVFTLAAMVMVSEFYFFLWLLLASLEWVGTFIVLAIIDYRETPAAQARMQMSRYLDMMEREQVARLRAMYGKEYVDA